MIKYVSRDLASVGSVSEHLVFDTPKTSTRVEASNFRAVLDLNAEITDGSADGIMIELDRMWLGRRHLRIVHLALKTGRAAYLYWANERLVERVSRGRILALYGQWGRTALARRLVRPIFVDSGAAEAGVIPDLPSPAASGSPAWDQFQTALEHFKGGISEFSANLQGLTNTRLQADSAAAFGRTAISPPASQMDQEQVAHSLVTLSNSVASIADSVGVWERITANFRDYLNTGVQMLESFRAQTATVGTGGGLMSELEVPAFIRQLQKLQEIASPVPFQLPGLPDATAKIKGTGVYMRMDFWAPMISGGSYGHTCFVAKELHAITEDMLCVMGNRLPLIDDMGIRQIVVRPDFTQYSDLHILSANEYYYTALKPLFEASRPAYIYERLCLGNTVAARLSRDLGIPYILEYNGSEISLKRSFDGTGYQQEAAFLAAEAFSFAQATLISVVSSHIRDDLVARGIDPAKILVNPNCVDPQEYAPAPSAEKHRIRKELNFSDDDCVVGFIGTFGGWHGIDVLADSLHPISVAAPNVRFLLIGDGNFRHQVDKAIEKNALQDRVVMAGRVPQVEGQRLLKACDIYVSPHNRHMIDGKFFGSPTKVFEYMAMEGGIVASDLEQMGQVLSPALRPQDVAKATVTDQRSVLCVPGDLDDFVLGVVSLAKRPELWKELGANARKAVIDYYTWRTHVENDFRYILGMPLVGHVADLAPKEKTAAS